MTDQNRKRGDKNQSNLSVNDIQKIEELKSKLKHMGRNKMANRNNNKKINIDIVGANTTWNALKLQEVQ